MCVYTISLWLTHLLFSLLIIKACLCASQWPLIEYMHVIGFWVAVVCISNL